jgi:hypothetical protein
MTRIVSLRGAARLSIFGHHPTFCDDIFIHVVYIASVDIGVAKVSDFTSANEGDDWCINLVSGSFLALEKVGQMAAEPKGVTSNRLALQGGRA